MPQTSDKQNVAFPQGELNEPEDSRKKGFDVIEADEAGLCYAPSHAMKRATGQPDPMD